MTKLCPRGKAAAKRKFKVYPSAYANAYASKICAGKIKDPSGTKRKDFKGPKPAGANEGTFVQAPKPPRRGKGKGPQRLSTDYLKKKKAYDALVGNDRKRKRMDPRMRPGAKKGALMIIIGVGKKKKVDKKMGGGMTAGSMSGMGRLQKARMMNKGGKIKKVFPTNPSIEQEAKDYYTRNYGSKEAKAELGERTRDKVKVKKMGGGMMKYNKGGGFDAGIPGKLRDLSTRYKSDGIRFKPGKGPEMTPDRKRRMQSLIDKRNKKEKIKGAIKKAVSAASPVTGAISAGKKLIDKYKSSKTKESSSGTGGASQRGRQNRRRVKKIPVMEARMGGDAKIKKVITGLNKASALHKAQAKSLQTVVGKSVGGMADYYKDLM